MYYKYPCYCGNVSQGGSTGNMNQQIRNLMNSGGTLDITVNNQVWQLQVTWSKDNEMLDVTLSQQNGNEYIIHTMLVRVNKASIADVYIGRSHLSPLELKQVIGWARKEWNGTIPIHQYIFGMILKQLEEYLMPMKKRFIQEILENVDGGVVDVTLNGEVWTIRLSWTRYMDGSLFLSGTLSQKIGVNKYKTSTFALSIRGEVVKDVYFNEEILQPSEVKYLLNRVETGGDIPTDQYILGLVLVYLKSWLVGKKKERGGINNRRITGRIDYSNN